MSSGGQFFMSPDTLSEVRCPKATYSDKTFVVEYGSLRFTDRDVALHVLVSRCAIGRVDDAHTIDRNDVSSLQMRDAHRENACRLLMQH